MSAARSLQGRVALITGGGRGIGAAIADRMAELGAKVVIANRTSSAAEAVAERIRSRWGQAIALTCDVSQRADIQWAVSRTVQQFGSLDIVVHNAAICVWQSINDLTEDTLEHTFAVNLKACFWLLQAAAPHLARSGHGRMLVTSSVTGPRVAMPNAVHYAASKAGVNGFIRGAALEYAAQHITVNGVEPGYIAKQQGSLLANPEKAQRIAQHIPLGELGDPDDIAHAMCFLASDAARYVTGQTLIVDGGSTLPESPFFMTTAEA